MITRRYILIHERGACDIDARCRRDILSSTSEAMAFDTYATRYYYLFSQRFRHTRRLLILMRQMLDAISLRREADIFFFMI